MYRSITLSLGKHVLQLSFSSAGRFFITPHVSLKKKSSQKQNIIYVTPLATLHDTQHENYTYAYTMKETMPDVVVYIPCFGVDFFKQFGLFLSSFVFIRTRMVINTRQNKIKSNWFENFF